MFADLSASPLFSAPLGTGKCDGGYGNVVTYCLLSVWMVALGGGVEGMITVSIQIIHGCGGVEGRLCMILSCSVRGNGNDECAKAGGYSCIMLALRVVKAGFLITVGACGGVEGGGCRSIESVGILSRRARP